MSEIIANELITEVKEIQKVLDSEIAFLTYLEGASLDFLNNQRSLSKEMPTLSLKLEAIAVWRTYGDMYSELRRFLNSSRIQSLDKYQETLDTILGEGICK